MLQKSFVDYYSKLRVAGIGCVVVCLLYPISLAGGDSLPKVFNGIDVLQKQNFKPLAGKRVGLITNHTGPSS